MTAHTVGETPSNGQTSLLRTVFAMRRTLYKRQFISAGAVTKVIAALFALLFAIGLSIQAAQHDPTTPAIVGGRTALALLSTGLLWTLLPILSGFSENTLQPRHFQLLPVNPKKLATALVFTSMFGITVPVTIAITAVIPIYALTHFNSALILAVIAWPATVFLFVLLSRVLSLMMSQLLTSRKSKEFAFIIFTTVLASLYFLQYPITNNFDRVIDGTITWPLTAAHSIPFAWGITSIDAAIDGNWLLAIAAVLGLLIIDALLLFAWQRLIVRNFNGTLTQSSGASAKQLKNEGKNIQKGWKTTQLGAVVSRELSLWGGDVRRRSQLALVAVLSLISGIGPLFSPAIPFNATWGAWIVIFTGLAAGNNMYGFDGKSLWHLVMIPKAIKADARGRQIVWLLIIMPFAVAATTIVRIFGDDGTKHLAVPIVITIVMLGVGAGLVIVSSVTTPFPMPEASKSSSLNTRSAFNGSAFAFLLLQMGILLFTTLPCALLAALTPEPYNYLSIFLAIVVGALGFWLGGRIAIKKMEKDADLILTAVSKSV